MASPRAAAFFACPGCGFARLLPIPPTAPPGGHDRYFHKAASKRRRAARLMGWLSRAAGGGGGDYLDIGCHAGYMLEAAAEAGFRVSGVEPDGAALALAARRVPAARLFAGRLGEVALPEAAFDLASAIEVIEHDPDPRAFAARLARALKPGALLYVTTPDWSHWRVPRDLARWDGFDPPRHVCYFTP
ncbi:MAG: class I SAM-dependent methyltransferase, partial [Alphaproteobacteria bacterium]|nr:class I SAM-dependent methyltransferase [Alphaproteobacteria bacterium]